MSDHGDGETTGSKGHFTRFQVTDQPAAASAHHAVVALGLACDEAEALLGDVAIRPVPAARLQALAAALWKAVALVDSAVEAVDSSRAKLPAGRPNGRK